jgi:hypothetical protein
MIECVIEVDLLIDRGRLDVWQDQCRPCEIF